MKHGLRVAAVAASVLLISGCDTDTDRDTAADPDVLTFEVSAAVRVQGFAFRPDNVLVAVDGEVTWTNEDDTAHPLRFEDGRTFALAGGESVTVSFDEQGMFAYRCGVHQGMSGTVTVGAFDDASVDTSHGGY